MDKSADERFVEVVTHFKEPVLELFNLYEEAISNAITYMFKALDIWTLPHFFDVEGEMSGIADALDKDYYEVMMMNFLYELDAYCTTSVVRMPNGEINMFRNLDFYFPNETRKILYVARFYRGGRFIYEAPMFAGMVGIDTAHRPGAFSLAINERNPDRSDSSFATNMAMLFSGYTQVSYLARRVMQECSDYDCAYYKLQQKTLIAGAYIILAGQGKNQGAVITRGRMLNDDIDKLSDSKWFLL